jgi:hypothetical protein
MKVLLSFSGERSRKVAKTLHDWLPMVIQAVKPWMSTEDLDKGARWVQELSGQLAQTKIGILCLTRENLIEPWINFEAGALSKTLDTTHVCTLLLGIEPADLSHPLAQFQATKAERDDALRLMQTLNGALGESALDAPLLERTFDTFWPTLEQSLREIAASEPAPEKPPRNEREILAEILGIVRDLAKRPTPATFDLFIVDARYGTKDSFKDVTRLLNERIVGGRLEINVSNNIAGDPLPGEAKWLYVDYIYGSSDVQKRVVPEGATLSLP